VPLVEAAAVKSQARKTMPAQRQVRIGFIVTKQYVIAWCQRLDQVALEQQRLGLGTGNGRLHGRDLLDHQLDARRAPAAGFLEIRGDPLLQVESLADVEHFAGAAHHAVDAGQMRQAGDGGGGVEHDGT
jgi:hypothetical protein